MKIHKLAAQFRSIFGIIETMAFQLSTPWVQLGPWFSVYLASEYYSDHGFPKSTVIVAIQPMASIGQERVLQKNDSIPVASGTCVAAWHLERAVAAVEAAGLGGFPPQGADHSGVPPRGNHPHWAHPGWSPCRGWGRWWEQNGLTCWRGRNWQTPGAVKR